METEMTASVTTTGRISRVGTGALPDVLLSSSGEQERREAWNRLIDSPLIEWGGRWFDFDDDEIDPPTVEAVQSATGAAMMLRDTPGAPAPDWCVGTGDGGIAFRWGEQGGFLLSYEFNADGSVERIVTEDCRTIHRSRVL